MDASVGFLLDNLQRLVEYHVELIGSAESDLKELNQELTTFKIILEKASADYKKDELFEQWESQIREAVYDIEDTIDSCVTLATADKAKKKNWVRKKLGGSGSKTIGLAEKVRKLREKTVKPLMDKFDLVKFSTADATETISADVRDFRQEKSKHIVGFEKEAQFFVDVLTGKSDKLEICSIIGMAGLGKTTLAWKIFDDPTVKFEIHVRIWVNISDTLNMKKVLLEILSKFKTKPDESLKVEELEEQVKGHLEKGKFLIVMDDIWELAAWKKLEAILPTNNTSGRVLITTRKKDVGHKASTSNEQAHNLRFLTSDESWDLLQYQVYGSLGVVPSQLVDIGQSIAVDCDGLPLSIVVIGGILEEKTSRGANNITLLENEWQEVSTSVKSYLVNPGDDRKKSLLESVLSLSYNKLPYQLRNCFLYLGVFPEDAEIPVKKLIHLWIAEGFIKEIKGKRLEEVAHNNLKELINRNLVTVRKEKPSGEAKVCQIHDSVREVCKREGEKLNLFQEVHEAEPRENIEKFRRLCVHSHATDFFSRLPNMAKARSFLCFNESHMTLLAEEAISVTDNFSLLRVYDAEKIKFPRFPSKFVQQINHLRYLTLAVDDVSFKILPEVVMDLWNLQTLIVDTPSPYLEVKGDVWKMRQLRHFKTHARIVLTKVGKGEPSDQKLQTLGRLSPESCTDEVCQKATSLLTLGIQGDLRLLGESNRLRNLHSVNKLKLVHEVPRGGTAENPWLYLPAAFPPKLKILVMSNTHLEWKKISIFSAMDTLEELKLKENAFQGGRWDANGKGFIRLACLYIDRADLQRWKVSDEHFPRLRFLQITNCEKLLEIPSTLGKSLEVLSLERVTPDAVIRANVIQQEQKKLERNVRVQIAVADNRQS